ncbi:MAG: DUF5941 domain-containing protein [Nitriliruptoraceae bacterium]
MSAMRRSHDRLGWTLPALARVVEYGVVLAVVGASPWTFALLATIAYHHYDAVYRPRTRGSNPPRWLGFGGWPVRAGLLAIAGFVGLAIPVAVVMTCVLATVYVTETIVDIRRDVRVRGTADAADIEQE